VAEKQDSKPAKRVIAIRPHPTSPRTHSLVLVEVKGRVWGIAWAGTPSEREAEDAWITDRRAFEPWDSVTGTFVRKASR